MRFSILIIFYSCVSATGLLLMKQGLLMPAFSKINFLENILNWKLSVGFMFYLLGFLIWIYILKQTPLTIAFPIASGLLYISLVIGSSLFLKENVSVLRIIGIGFVFIGISIISRTS